MQYQRIDGLYYIVHHTEDIDCAYECASVTNQTTNVKPHCCGKRKPRGWSRAEVEGQAGMVGRSSYCGGNFGEDCMGSVVPDP